MTNTSQEGGSLLKLQLPHPYLTTYHVVNTRGAVHGLKYFQVRRGESQGSGRPEPEVLHNEDLLFSELQAPSEATLPPLSNNTPWARAQRGQAINLTWRSQEAPSLGQVWLIIYAVFTQSPDLEFFKVNLKGAGSAVLMQRLKSTSLAVDSPGKEGSVEGENSSELLIVRGAFWQGACSPIGSKSAWIPEHEDAMERSISSGLPALGYTMTTKFPDARVHAWHPRRPQKPTPGSVIYSRYIPTLDENFSMIALDYQDEEHLGLFHKWQNDPRVAAGWNETGTLEEHRRYLKNLHDDPHTLTVLARFDEVCFAYFEIYWAKEDHLGAYYDAGDFDRGRHSLVGDERYRGRHRVTAWWSSLMHYMFLDDPRTMHLVGEPKVTNSSVLAYDLMHGFHLEKLVDLPHKRSAFVRCSREKFFQLCPLDLKGGIIAGMGIALPSKL